MNNKKYYTYISSESVNNEYIYENKQCINSFETFQDSFQYFLQEINYNKDTDSEIQFQISNNENNQEFITLYFTKSNNHKFSVIFYEFNYKPLKMKDIRKNIKPEVF